MGTATYVVNRDIPRRLLGLSRKAWNLMERLERETIEATLGLAFATRSGSAKMGPHRAGMRLFSYAELEEWVGGNPRSATRIIHALEGRGILRRFKAAQVRRLVNANEPEESLHLSRELGIFPWLSGPPEIYVPPGARVVYEYRPVLEQVKEALKPRRMAEYLSARILSAAERNAVKVAQGSEGPAIFLIHGDALELPDNPVPFGNLRRAAERLMDAHAKRSFSTFGSGFSPKPKHWWWTMRAPMIVIDFSFPRYDRAAPGAAHLMLHGEAVEMQYDRYRAQRGLANLTSGERP
jgi:hypothetical protein